MRQTLLVDGASYEIEVLHNISRPPSAPRLVVVSYLPNQTAVDLLKACIGAIQNFTTIPHEIWIVDNNSPAENNRFLREIVGVNVIFNYRTPTPQHHISLGQRVFNRIKGRGKKGQWGSYANGIALEIGARCIDPATEVMMTLHMDTMPCHRGWLAFLCSKLDDSVAAAGVRFDTGRVPDGILHVLGYLFRFQLYQELNLSFLPQMPQFDVGDKVIHNLRNAGYKIYACRNSFHDQALTQLIEPSSPLFSLPVDRSFDDEDNVMFLHLGRGIKKSSDENNAIVQQWLQLTHLYENAN